MLKGRMDFRIGNETRSMTQGDVAVIPGNVEHEGFFPEDTEVVDVFSPPREDFSNGTAALVHGCAEMTLPGATGCLTVGEAASQLKDLLVHACGYLEYLLSFPTTFARTTPRRGSSRRFFMPSLIAVSSMSLRCNVVHRMR